MGLPWATRVFKVLACELITLRSDDAEILGAAPIKEKFSMHS